MNPQIYRLCLEAQLVGGDTAGYRRYLDRLFEPQDKENGASFELSYAGVLLDGAVKATRLVQLREHLLERSQSSWDFHAAGLAHYRAGQFEKALERLVESLKNPGLLNEAVGHASELGIALAHHRLGHAKEARQWLDKAEEWYEKAIQDALASPTATANFCRWWDWPNFVVLRREAHKVILGKDFPDDPRLKQLADRVRDWLKQRDKATADYDVAVFLEPNEPRLLLARARRLAELKRDNEAVADLAKAVELKSNDAEVWRECGRLHFELGQTDKAAADFRLAVALFDDRTVEALIFEPVVSEADKLLVRLADDDGLLKRLTTAIEHNPEDTGKIWYRAEWHARHRRWKEAAADYQIVLERQPLESRSMHDAWQWLHAAPAFLAAGDREGYRRLRREMLKRFGDTQDIYTAERIAKACLLLPESAKDSEPACQLMDRAVTVGKFDAGAELWIVLYRGLADYRRGNWRAAALALDPRVPQVGDANLATCYHLILAMAYHRQGETKVAREHLTQAAKTLDRHVADPGRFPQFSDGRYNHDWLIAWVLHREAQTLIDGGKR